MIPPLFSKRLNSLNQKNNNKHLFLQTLDTNIEIDAQVPWNCVLELTRHSGKHSLPYFGTAEEKQKERKKKLSYVDNF